MQVKVSLFRKYLLDPLVSSSSPPWYDARGIGIGLFIGFGVPVGLQIVLLGGLRAILPFNTVMAFAFTWVNNPLSVIPMYYGYYYIGSLLLNKPPLLSASDFREMMMPVMNAEFFWESISRFAVFGMDFVMRWTVAALIIGLCMGGLGYWVGYYIQKEHCRRNAKKLGLTYEKLLVKLNEEISGRSQEHPRS